MAAKRFLDDDYEDDQNQVKQKRRFHNVIREVVMLNFFKSMCSSLEPMLRRVVREEVENGLKRRRLESSISIPTCPSLQIQIQIQMPNLKLTFTKPLSLPIFTGTKILDIHNNPLQIMLMETNSNYNIATDHEVSTSSIKVEILVVDGDFCGSTMMGETWSEEEFAKNIVKERAGKRPLLAGDLNVNIRDGVGIVGDIEFTDNSSWIRSRKFRIGARVVQIQAGQCVRIIEAMTQPFVVKDHRGELYKKHHPPALEDEVWRLEKIGKGGVFHQKLALEGINTVQDFLKLFIIDSSKLRRIMGGMSEKMWEAILKHANSCELGNKLYRSHGNNYILTLNPICQVTKIEINGQVYMETDLRKMQKAYIESLVKEAHSKWSSLEEVDTLTHHNTQLLTNGEMMDNERSMFMRSYNMGEEVLVDGSLEVDSMTNNNQQRDYSEWAIDSGFYISGQEGV